MSNVEKISISLPRDMMEDLNAAVERGAYATTSEVIRDAVRDWQKKDRSTRLERLTPKSHADLKRMIQAGIDSLEKHGGIPAEQVFDRLEKKYAAMARARKKPPGRKG
jgi:antitoxin ParD1/3/4